MKSLSFAIALCALTVCPLAFSQATDIKETAAGTTIGRTSDKKIGFHGVAPTAQRSGAAQVALMDLTGGSTSAYSLASTVGVTTVTIPLTSLATGLSTSAIDLLTDYAPGYAFKVLSFEFVTTVVGTGTSASQTFNLEIGSTNLTGGSLNVTLASANTIGKITSGTAITAANTGTASDTISLEMAASGTVFTAGAGYFIIKLQNLDVANAFAREARLTNELRDALVAKGLIKGSN